VEEGRSATEQDEDSNSETPVVASLIVGLSLHDFRSHVPRCSSSGGGQVVNRNRASQSEVGKLYDGGFEIFIGEQQILRLNIAMDDWRVLLVAVDDGIKYWDHKRVHIRLFKSFSQE